MQAVYTEDIEQKVQEVWRSHLVATAPQQNRQGNGVQGDHQGNGSPQAAAERRQVARPRDAFVQRSFNEHRVPV